MDGISFGGREFAAVKIDSDGSELWRWLVKRLGFIHANDVVLRVVFRLNHIASYTYIGHVYRKYVPNGRMLKVDKRTPRSRWCFVCHVLNRACQ